MKIGQEIMIISMIGERNYQGKSGTITGIDDAGQLHGTWGSLAIIPGVDKFINVEENKDDRFRAG